MINKYKNGLGLLCGLVLAYCPPLLAGSAMDIVDDDWIELKTANFHIISDANEKYVRSFAYDLESFRYYAPKFINGHLKDDVKPLKVFALKSESNFKKLRHQKDIAGFFFRSLDRNFAVANLKGYSIKKREGNFARQTLLHEYVHFLVRNAKQEIHQPVWYNEGLADFMSTMVVEDKTLKFGLPLKGRIWGADKGSRVPIESIFKAVEYPKTERERTRFYSYSWALYHLLFSDSELMQANMAFIQNWIAGQTVDEAYANSYPISYDELAKLLGSYIRKGKYRYWNIGLESAFELEVQSLKKLTEPEVAFYLAEMQFFRPSDMEQRKGFLQDAEELLQFAVSNNAEETLIPSARSYQLGIQMAEADDLSALEMMKNRLDQLAADYPKSSQIATRLGDWHRAVSEKLKLAGDDSWFDELLEARRKYRRAIHLDNSNLRAYSGLAAVYRDWRLVRQGQGLEEALAVYNELNYFTNDPHVRYELARLYEYKGEPETALHLFRKVTLSHSENLVEKAQANIERLESLAAAESATADGGGEAI